MGECRGRIEARRGDGNGGSTVVSQLKQRDKKGERVMATFKEQRGGFVCSAVAQWSGRPSVGIEGRSTGWLGGVMATASSSNAAGGEYRG